MNNICYVCGGQAQPRFRDNYVACGKCAPLIHKEYDLLYGTIKEDSHYQQFSKTGDGFPRGTFWSSVIESLMAKLIVVKDQKCNGCNLSAPHRPPNKDGKFICVSCQVIGELG